MLGTNRLEIDRVRCCPTPMITILERLVRCNNVERQTPPVAEIRVRQAVLPDNKSFHKLSYPTSHICRRIPWRSSCLGPTDNQERNVPDWCGDVHRLNIGPLACLVTADNNS